MLESFITPPKNIRKNQITDIVMYNDINPLPGLEIGIPINVFENIFTNIHYGHDIHLPYFIILSCLIGYVTYGTDRFLDALEYYDNNKEIPISENKKKLYNYMVNNQKLIKSTLVISNIALVYILEQDEQTIPFIFLLVLSNFYKQIKKEFGILKAPFIGVMWTLASVILPCVLYEHNYDIFYHPTSYLPAFLSLFAASNTADITDQEEDKENNITTIPVKFGSENSIYLNLILLFLSSLIFGFKPNYMNRPFVNTLFELNNAGASFVNFKLLNTNITINEFINPGNYTINI